MGPALLARIQTADTFWKLYSKTLLETPKHPYSIDQFRHEALLGFTAIDATLSAFWFSEVTAHWDEYLCLFSALATRPPSYVIDSLSKKQLFESLRFIQRTGAPENFSPSFIDAGIVFLALNPPGPSSSLVNPLGKLLVKAQPLRNAVVHTGKTFTEQTGAESRAVIKEFVEKAPKQIPLFEKIIQGPFHLIDGSEPPKKAA